jgi:hypothetical protein
LLLGTCQITPVISTGAPTSRHAAGDSVGCFACALVPMAFRVSRQAPTYDSHERTRSRPVFYDCVGQFRCRVWKSFRRQAFPEISAAFGFRRCTSPVSRGILRNA